MMEYGGKSKPREVVYFGEYDIERLGRPVRTDIAGLTPEGIIRTTNLITDFANGKDTGIDNLGDGFYQLGKISPEKVRVILYRLHGYDKDDEKEGVYVVASVFQVKSDKKRPNDMISAINRIEIAVADKEAILAHVERKNSVGSQGFDQDSSRKTR